MSQKELFNVSGNLEEELLESNLDAIAGAGVGDWIKKISKSNDGKYCSLTWECSLCPTHTCFC